MFALLITFLEYDEPNFFLIYNVRWLFAVSSNYHLLEKFRNKIYEYTSPERRPYMLMEIIPFNQLSKQECKYNNLQFPYYQDRLYTEGIVNLNDGPSYSYDEFGPEHWNL